ncbi:hypothetical protein, partial [Pseudonocardia asaccharolytica]
MADQLDPQEVARRVETVLAGMAEPRTGEELVRLLMRFYGAGLEQIVAIARAAGGEPMVHRLAA